VDESSELLRDGGDHAGMAVAEGRAHLTGVEVQIGLAFDVPDERARPALEDRAADVGPVQTPAEAMALRALEPFALGHGYLSQLTQAPRGSGS